MKITYVCSLLIKSLYGFGGHCLNIRDVGMDFEPCFKVYNLVFVQPKSMKLGKNGVNTEIKKAVEKSGWRGEGGGGESGTVCNREIVNRLRFAHI